MQTSKIIKFEYDTVFVCGDVPQSLIDGLTLSKEREPVDYITAARQHSDYLSALKNLGLRVIEIKSSELFPDCVFVEDTIVAIGNRLFVTNPGAETRRDEVKLVKARLEEVANEINIQIREVQNKQEAFIDGGDVCFTGRELLVGKSGRTNQAGIEELRSAFEDLGVEVVECDVIEGLHLKSALTMLATDTILISSSQSAQNVKKQIEERSKFAKFYKFIQVPKDIHANVLLINGTLFYDPEFSSVYEKAGIRSFIENKSVKAMLPLENSEFRKIDGCLTCRSVLFSTKIKVA